MKIRTVNILFEDGVGFSLTRQQILDIWQFAGDDEKFEALIYFIATMPRWTP